METAANSSADRSQVGRKRDPQRSAVTNGKLLPGIDQRSAWVRRAKDVIAAHLSGAFMAARAASMAERLARRAKDEAWVHRDAVFPETLTLAHAVLFQSKRES
jgi:hypothetical protein